jgi:hypothetical protein
MYEVDPICEYSIYFRTPMISQIWYMGEHSWLVLVIQLMKWTPDIPLVANVPNLCLA